MITPPPPPFNIEAELRALAGEQDRADVLAIIALGGMHGPSFLKFAQLCQQRQWSARYAERVEAIVQAAHRAKLEEQRAARGEVPGQWAKGSTADYDDDIPF